MFGIQRKNCLRRKPTEDAKKHAIESEMSWFMFPEPETDLRACQKKPNVDAILDSLSFQNAENKTVYFMSKICLKKDEITEVFSATEGQRDNPLWGMYQKGRITSSSFI